MNDLKLIFQNKYQLNKLEVLDNYQKLLFNKKMIEIFDITLLFIIFSLFLFSPLNLNIKNILVMI